MCICSGADGSTTPVGNRALCLFAVAPAQFILMAYEPATKAKECVATVRPEFRFDVRLSCVDDGFGCDGLETLVFHRMPVFGAVPFVIIVFTRDALVSRLI